MWIFPQIFVCGKLSHFIDGRGAAGNWMAYVNSARHEKEQNLTAIQVRNYIIVINRPVTSSGTKAGKPRSYLEISKVAKSGFAMIFSRNNTIFI